MRRLGMKMPIRTLIAARSCSLSVPLACSILMQETGGGVNEFGHDPTIFVGAGAVTKAKYLKYRIERDRLGYGTRCQGVNVTQLTYVGFQARADGMGGCWKPLVAMRVGFADLAHNVRVDGLREGVRAYNGGGAAADKYAAEVIMRAQRYAVDLRLPKP